MEAAVAGLDLNALVRQQGLQAQYNALANATGVHLADGVAATDCLLIARLQKRAAALVAASPVVAALEAASPVAESTDGDGGPAAEEQQLTPEDALARRLSQLQRSGVGVALPAAGYLSVAAGGLHEVLRAARVPLRYVTGASGGARSGLMMLCSTDSTTLLMGYLLYAR